jgi:hypothetical protein
MSDPKGRPERQDSLPFPPTPSASIAGRTMQESVYKQRVKPRRLPADAPNSRLLVFGEKSCRRSDPDASSRQVLAGRAGA